MHATTLYYLVVLIALLILAIIFWYYKFDLYPCKKNTRFNNDEDRVFGARSTELDQNDRSVTIGTFPILNSHNGRNNYSTDSLTRPSFSTPYPTSPQHPLPYSIDSSLYMIPPSPETTHLQIVAEAVAYLRDSGIHPTALVNDDLNELLPGSHPLGRVSSSNCLPSYAEAVAAENATTDYKRTRFDKSST